MSSAVDDGPRVDSPTTDMEPAADGPPVQDVEIEVRYAETDAQGVVHHSNYVVWFEVARTALCKQTGYPYAEIEAMGYNLVVTGTRTRHRRGAHYGDTVTARCRLARFQSRGLEFAYEILRQGTLIATGETQHIWVSRQSGRPARLPEPVEAAFKRLADPAP